MTTAEILLEKARDNKTYSKSILDSITNLRNHLLGAAPTGKDPGEKTKPNHCVTGEIADNLVDCRSYLEEINGILGHMNKELFIEELAKSN
jgi:hypothetical protein